MRQPSLHPKTHHGHTTQCRKKSKRNKNAGEKLSAEWMCVTPFFLCVCVQPLVRHSPSWTCCFIRFVIYRLFSNSPLQSFQFSFRFLFYWNKYQNLLYTRCLAICLFVYWHFKQRTKTMLVMLCGPLVEFQFRFVCEYVFFYLLVQLFCFFFWRSLLSCLLLDCILLLLFLLLAVFASFGVSAVVSCLNKIVCRLNWFLLENQFKTNFRWMFSAKQIVFKCTIKCVNTCEWNIRQYDYDNENGIELRIASTLTTMWLCRNEFTIRWALTFN